MAANTESDVITDALTLVGAVAAGEDVDANDYLVGRRTLQRMIAVWQTMGVHLWTRKQGVLFYQPAQAKYVTGTDHIIDSSELIETTTTAAMVTNDTVVPATSVTGMAASDFIGIKLDDGTIHWTTIVSISVLNITITTGIPSAAASGVRVYTYTTKLQNALRVKSVRNFQYSTGTDGNEIEMLPLANKDYFALPTKGTSGVPVQFYFNPNITSADFYIWPVPTATDYLAKFTYYAQITQPTTTSETLDFPDEWLEPLVYGLADRLIPSFPGLVGTLEAQEIKMRAQDSMNVVKDWDQGDQSIYLGYSTMRRP